MLIVNELLLLFMKLKAFPIKTIVVCNADIAVVISPHVTLMLNENIKNFML
jgi:hypothetical protein